MAGQPGAEFIVTDIDDSYFTQIGQELEALGIAHRFIRTDACQLDGIAPESIDFVVCNFVLCAVNAEVGSGTIALDNFYSVLKPGGKLYLREEYPIYAAKGPDQEVWALMWRVIKSARMISSPYLATTEYRPEVLKRLCEIVGFEDINWIPEVIQNDLSWFVPRMELLTKMMPDFPNPQVGKMYLAMASDIRQRAAARNSVEIPRYSMVATKPF
jgi:ubiquinone/menaquinone biosynthesis C-methylase UbiE